MGESTKYLIIGGGVASVSAAKGIRQHDKEGRVVLMTSNVLMPYDRPPLSKGFLSNREVTHDDISSKYDVWYTDNKIEVRLETTASRIDRTDHSVTTSTGEVFQYEKLLIATGSRARRLEEPWVHALRTIEDGIAVRDAMHTAKVAAIVGAGFLGPEVAGQCLSTGIPTVLIAPDPYLWGKFASPALGAFLNGYYKSKGLKLFLNQSSVTSLEEGTPSAEELRKGFVLAAIGVELNTDIAKEAGFELSDKGAIEVDEFLTTVSDPDVYAAGDVANFPEPLLGSKTHHEHHLNAQWQGEAAGANMAGQRTPYRRIPYFFSDFLDLHMVLRGAVSNTDHTKLIGSFDSADFIELYADEAGSLKMGIAISREEKKLDPISDKLEEMIGRGEKVADLSADSF